MEAVRLPSSFSCVCECVCACVSFFQARLCVCVCVWKPLSPCCVMPFCCVAFCCSVLLLSILSRVPFTWQDNSQVLAPHIPSAEPHAGCGHSFGSTSHRKTLAEEQKTGNKGGEQAGSRVHDLVSLLGARQGVLGVALRRSVARQLWRHRIVRLDEVLLQVEQDVLVVVGEEGRGVA